jgi:glucosamine--fructose-6-phosphate aminotransferase (isomerizing)
MTGERSERRAQHPFHMYEAMRAQPAAFARMVRLHDTALAEFAARIATCERLFLVGTGTSHHAARVGGHILRAFAGGVPTHAYPAFDFALYGLPLTPQDCVVGISHRGTKQYTVQSLARARDAGCHTALITGEGTAPGRAAADVVFQTVPQEESSAHTISYVAAIAVLAALAGHLGHQRTGRSHLPEDLLTKSLPAALEEGLAQEPLAASWAQAYLGRRRIWVVGGGPSEVTAHEIALKIRETSYLQAEGMSIETILHGPFQCAEADDVFVLIAPAGAACSRVIEFAPMVSEIGAPYLVVSDGTPRALHEAAAGWCAVPAVPEPFTALTCLVPLQLFSYHLALRRGTNPDGFRLDDPRFDRARARVQL